MDIYTRVPGTPLKSGTITIPADEGEQLAVVLESPQRQSRDTLHPLYAYVAAQRGIGVRIPELCALADFDIDDGPMLGSVELELHRPLLADTPYRVDGEVVSLDRKRGRTLGRFDLMTFREWLTDDTGDIVSTSTVSFVLPRSEDSS